MNTMSLMDQVKTGDLTSGSNSHIHQSHVNFQNITSPPLQPNVGSMVPPQFPMYSNAQYHPGMVQTGVYPNASQMPVGNGGMMMNMQGVGFSDMYQMEGLLYSNGSPA